MRLWIVALLACATAIQVDIYGDRSEIDEKTVAEAKKYIVGACYDGVKIDGLDFYETTKHRNKESLKLMIEDDACRIENIWKNRMSCDKGSVDGATVTYVRQEICKKGDGMDNMIASHIPTGKIQRAAKLMLHLTMALKKHRSICSTPLQPRCGALKARTDTPHVRKSVNRYSSSVDDSNSSDMDMDNSLTETDNDREGTTPSTTTVTTESTTLDLNNTEPDSYDDIFYVPDTEETSESEINIDDGGNERESKRKSVFDKVQGISRNIEAIIDGLDESGNTDNEIILVTCIALSCLLILINIIVQCIRNKPNVLRRLGNDLQEVNDLSRNLEERLWGEVPQNRRYV